MSKNKFYITIIIILSILNLALLCFHFLLNPKKNNKPVQPKEIIIKKLRLDENQIKNYEKLIVQHQQTIMALDDTIFELKGELYLQLNNNSQSTDSLTHEIALKQAEVEKVHFEHLLAIKNLCKPEQLPNYSELTKEFSTLFLKLPSRKENEK